MARPEYVEKHWFHQGKRKQEIIKEERVGIKRVWEK
jgi:hypothetical protein